MRKRKLCEETKVNAVLLVEEDLSGKVREESATENVSVGRKLE